VIASPPKIDSTFAKENPNHNRAVFRSGLRLSERNPGTPAMQTPAMEKIVAARGPAVFQPLRNGIGEARLEIQQQFVGETKHVQVALHFPLRRDQRGVTAFADLKPFHIVRDLAVKKANAIRAGQTNPSAKTQVDDANRFVESRVFREPIAIIIDHSHAVQFAETAAQLMMKFVQNQRVHWLYLKGFSARRNRQSRRSGKSRFLW
jgi:hypothetical protein